MALHARTPEELDLSFEDAFVIRDPDAVARLFEQHAVLVAGSGEARGPERIAALIAFSWESRRTYVAAPRRIVQARDTALVLGQRSTAVVRRGPDGMWRYAIALAAFDPQGQEEEGRR